MVVDKYGMGQKFEINPIAANPKHNLVFVTNNTEIDKIPLAYLSILSFAANDWKLDAVRLYVLYIGNR